MIRALVVADHPVEREGLKQIFSKTTDVVVAGEAHVGPEAIDRVKTGSYGVVVLDLSTPGMSGLDLLKLLKQLKPELPVLVLSVRSVVYWGARLFKAGASGFLGKESSPEELVSAVRTVCAGKRYVDERLAEKLLDSALGKDDDPLIRDLTDREFQVLGMIAYGKSVKDIAERLSLSPKTVAGHRSRVMRLTGSKSDADLIRCAIGHGLIPLDTEA